MHLSVRTPAVAAAAVLVAAAATLAPSVGAPAAAATTHAKPKLPVTFASQDLATHTVTPRKLAPLIGSQNVNATSQAHIKAMSGYGTVSCGDLDLSYLHSAWAQDSHGCTQISPASSAKNAPQPRYVQWVVVHHNGPDKTKAVLFNASLSTEAFDPGLSSKQQVALVTAWSSEQTNLGAEVSKLAVLKLPMFGTVDLGVTAALPGVAAVSRSALDADIAHVMYRPASAAGSTRTATGGAFTASTSITASGPLTEPTTTTFEISSFNALRAVHAAPGGNDSTWPSRRRPSAERQTTEGALPLNAVRLDSQVKQEQASRFACAGPLSRASDSPSSKETTLMIKPAVFAATAVLGASVVLLAGCGTSPSAAGSSDAQTSFASRPTAVPPTATDDPNQTTQSTYMPSAAAPTTMRTSNFVGAPGGSYIALCNPKMLSFLEATSGDEISHLDFADVVTDMTTGATDPTGAQGTFAPAGGPDPFQGFDCANLSYNGDMTRIAGIDKYDSGDSVPAYLDLASGVVTDTVSPQDHSGFSAVKPRAYIAALFDPRNNSIWSLKDLGNTPDGEIYQLENNAGGITQRWQCGTDDQAHTTLYFGLNPAQPYPDDGGDGSCTQVGGPPAPPVAPAYMNQNQLPATDYIVSNILLSNTGKSAAFMGSPPDFASQSVFVVSAHGGKPVELSRYPSPHSTDPSDPGSLSVARYHEQ